MLLQSRHPTAEEHAALLEARLTQLQKDVPDVHARELMKANFEKLIADVKSGREPALKHLLSADVIEKASLGGLEYAWRPSDVEIAIQDARHHHLETIGGQAQFLFPDATCELYWIEIGPSERRANERWCDGVERSADEAIARFRDRMSKTDWDAEAKAWPFLCAQLQVGIDVMDHLYFALYFCPNPLEPG